jgi:CheY-like chemotaxis protein
MPADVLIVDDEPAVRQLLKMVVRTMNMSFSEAEDGIDALEKIAADPPRMIILDVMMPRMDGLTMLKKLRTQPQTAAIPVLLFTAFRVPSHDIEDLNMPPQMIMNKGSMSVSAIRAVLNEALQPPQLSPMTAPQPQPQPAPVQAAQPVQAPPKPVTVPGTAPSLQPRPANRPLSTPVPNRPPQIPPSSLKPLPPKQIDAK